MSAGFRDDSQRGLACKALLDSIRKTGLWDEDGLTASGQSVWETHAWKAWSHGERIIWGVAWAVWRGDDEPPATFSEIIYTLDNGLMQMVGELTFALTSARALDVWIAKYSRPWR
jgi:hypothetical protein